MGTGPLRWGEDARVARAHALAIGQDLARLVSESDDHSPRFLRVLTDVGVFFAYEGIVTSSRESHDLAWRCMDRVAGHLEDLPLSPALYGGYSGIGWAADYAMRCIAPEDRASQDDDPASPIDDALLEVLGERPWRNHYDLIGGLCGFAAYFNQRMPRESAQRGMQLILEHLDETKSTFPEGLTWLTRPELLPDWQREIHPEGHYNVGLAHGVPGILVTLSMARKHGILRDKARRLSDELVEWLQSIRQDAHTIGSAFPTWWMPGRDPNRSRQAWCYGDPGVGAAWLTSALLVGDADWKRNAVDVLRFCAKVDEPDAGIGDAGLCHGSAGLAHLYNRVYQATGLDDFRTAAVRWFRRTFEYRGREGFGGYRTYLPPFMAARSGMPIEGPWVVDPSFLTGSVGVGLAYLAAVSTVDPDWDRILMLNMPPVAGRAPDQEDEAEIDRTRAS